MWVIYKVHCWDGLRWHDIHTKLHEDWFLLSGNIKVIALTIWKAAVLVLLMRRIYDVCHCDDFRWHDTYIPCFITIIWQINGFLMYATEMASGGMIHIPSLMMISSDIHVILRFCLSNLNDCNICITDERDLWSASLRWLHVAWNTYGTGVQSTLRFSLRNLRGCNVGITKARDSWTMPLRWAQVPWCT
jgi:hypothetical protein